MEECLFCKIVKGEIPCQKVYEDGDFFAFLDINPRNPGHTLVIPKNHYETIFDMPDNEIDGYLHAVKKVASAVKSGMRADGISIAQSNGRAAGQVVAHAHFHVIPRFLSEGPPGLESMLSAKKLTEEMLKKTSEAIKSKMGSEPSKAPGPTEAPPQPKKQSVEDEFDF